MQRKSSLSITSVRFICTIMGLLGCKQDQGASQSAKTVISNSGSDTMVNLAQSWAEEYEKVASNISVEVGGGGSGVGIRDGRI